MQLLLANPPKINTPNRWRWKIVVTPPSPSSRMFYPPRSETISRQRISLGPSASAELIETSESRLSRGTVFRSETNHSRHDVPFDRGLDKNGIGPRYSAFPCPRNFATPSDLFGPIFPPTFGYFRADRGRWGEGRLELSRVCNFFVRRDSLARYVYTVRAFRRISIPAASLSLSVFAAPPGCCLEFG